MSLIQIEDIEFSSSPRLKIQKSPLREPREVSRELWGHAPEPPGKWTRARAVQALTSQILWLRHCFNPVFREKFLSIINAISRYTGIK